jgi:hypothetical protein
MFTMALGKTKNGSSTPFSVAPEINGDASLDADFDIAERAALAR